MAEHTDLEVRSNLPDFDRMTWPEFSRMLDAYRDAAYWAGYEDAKKEWIRKIIEDFNVK